MTIYEKLLAIQTELKAPKGQYNSFGNYKYRSCEDILEALKPFLAKYKCTLFFQDDVVAVGERVYVKTIATLRNVEDVDIVQTQAMAREEEVKKGMDGSQITGAASSYARKYCLNGMFCIDDTKDSDTTNNAPREYITAEQKKVFEELGVNTVNACKKFSVSTVDGLTKEQAQYVIDMKKAQIAKGNAQ